MKIKLPFKKASKLVMDLIRFLPHGFTPEEGHQLAVDLTELGFAILEQVVPSSD